MLIHSLCQSVLSLIIDHLAIVLLFQLFLLNLGSTQLHMNRACKGLILDIFLL